MSEQEALATVELRFRELLSRKREVAIEEAARNVITPDNYDRRGFGCIARKLLRDGEIREVSFGRSELPHCNQSPIRKWTATEKLRVEVSFAGQLWFPGWPENYSA